MELAYTDSVLLRVANFTVAPQEVDGSGSIGVAPIVDSTANLSVTSFLMSAVVWVAALMPRVAML